MVMIMVMKCKYNQRAPCEELGHSWPTLGPVLAATTGSEKIPGQAGHILTVLIPSTLTSTSNCVNTLVTLAIVSGGDKCHHQRTKLNRTCQFLPHNVEM